MVKGISQKSPLEKQASIAHLYSAHDPIPVPEVIDCDSDTAWALWEDSVTPQSSERDTDFINTVPAELPLAPPKRRS
jgi:hypothetical protein